MSAFLFTFPAGDAQSPAEKLPKASAFLAYLLSRYSACLLRQASWKSPHIVVHLLPLWGCTGSESSKSGAVCYLISR